MNKTRMNKWVPNFICNSCRNDLVRDSGQPKGGSGLLASFLKGINFLEPKTKYFIKDGDLSLVSCTYVERLINELKENCYGAKH